MSQQSRTAAAELQDPVCGMTVRLPAKHEALHEGRRHVFCCAGCREKFLANPTRYLPGAKAAAAQHPEPRPTPQPGPPSAPPPAPPPASPGAFYTCPMHPEVRTRHPDTCPLCGMQLEPLLPVEVEDDAPLREVRRRFAVCAALALPVVILAMGPHLFHRSLADGTAHVLRALELALSLPVVLWGGRDYLRRGWQGVRQGSPNMYTLIGAGVTAAYLYSVIATALPASFPPPMHDQHGLVPVYFEGATVIVTLVLLGEWLEMGARRRTTAAIRQLLGLAP